MDSCQRIFEPPFLIPDSDFHGSPVGKFPRSSIKNHSRPYLDLRNRRVTSPVKYLPSKTIDGEGGQPNDRSAIWLTTLPLHQNIEVRGMDYCGFRRERG
jgi:hypothetical protein